MTKQIEGHIEELISHNIFLNINNLEKGSYNLIIIHRNRIVKSTHFTKK